MKSEINKNLLYDYVNDLLSDNEKVVFEKQLTRSAELQNDLKRVKQYYSLVKSSEPSEVPRDFIENVHRKIGIFNELPDNGVSPVFRAATSAPSLRRVNDKTHDNLQGEKKKNSLLKSRFKRWIPFEIAGVMATVAILVFIFIPNVNMPEISRKTVYDESAVMEFEKNKITDDKQMPLEKDNAASEMVVQKPVVPIDKKVSGNVGVSVKDKAKNNDVLKHTEVQSTAKVVIADEHKSREVPAPSSPVPSTALSMSRSSVAPAAKEETNKSALPAIAPKRSAAAEETDADIVAMSSTKSDEKRSLEPIRIILRGAASSSPELSTAPSSMPSERKKMKTRRSERAILKTSKAEITESENMTSTPSGADAGITVKIDKNDIESLLSESNITWKLVLLEEKRLLYRVNGTGQTVKQVVDKLKTAGFIEINMPSLSDDSVDVELEINY